MALFLSQIATAISGSVGGTTYGHNAGGMYMRARATPVQPNTSNQAVVKAAMTTSVAAWNSTLTPAQRAAWNLYAVNTPVTNALGQTITLSGQNMFLRSRIPYLQALSKLAIATPSVLIAPTTFDRGVATTPATVAATEGAGVIWTFSASATENASPDAVIMLWQGRPRNASRSYFRGPWRLIGNAVGDDSVPPTTVTVSAVNVTARGFPIVGGQMNRFAITVLYGDNRYTSRLEGPDVLVP